MPTTRERLIWDLRELYGAILTTGPKDMASLSREFRSLLAQLHVDDVALTREYLTNVRDQIEAALPTADHNVLAGLSREYRNVLTALEALPNEEAAPQGVDAIREQREQRKATTGTADPSAPVGAPGVG